MSNVSKSNGQSDGLANAWLRVQMSENNTRLMEIESERIESVLEHMLKGVNESKTDSRIITRMIVEHLNAMNFAADLIPDAETIFLRIERERAEPVE